MADDTSDQKPASVENIREAAEALNGVFRARHPDMDASHARPVTEEDVLNADKVAKDLKLSKLQIALLAGVLARGPIG